MGRGNGTSRAVLAAALFWVLTCSAGAQETPRVEGDLKAATARKLIQITGGGHLGIQVIDTLIESFKKAHPGVPETFWTEFRAGIHPEDIVELTVPIYSRYLSAEDMQQLIAFYQSPVGQKLLQVQPQIVQDSMAAGGQWGRELARQILEKLKEKGYGEKTRLD